MTDAQDSHDATDAGAAPAPDTIPTAQLPKVAPAAAPGGEPAAITEALTIPASTPAVARSEAAPAPTMDKTSPVGIPRIGLSPISEAPPPAAPAPTSTTLLVDAPPQHLRRTEDLLDLVLSLLGIGSMLLLAVYAHATTTGVTQDVQNALSSILKQVLVFPLQAVEGLVTFLLPVIVLLERMLRGSWRSAGQAALGAIGGWAAGILTYHVVAAWAPAVIVSGLTVAGSGEAQLSISATFAALAGLLTGAGERRSAPVVRYGWVAVWTVIGLALLRSALNIPGALLTILLGRAVGLAVRYAFGVEDRRAHGVALIRALRRAGVDAVRVVRMDSAPHVQAWTVTTDAPLGYTEQVRENPRELAPDTTETNPATTPSDASGAEASSGVGNEKTEEQPAGTLTDQPAPGHTEAGAGPSTEANTDPNSMTPALDVDLDAILAEAHSAALVEGRTSVHRIYAAWDADGVRRDVTILDADRQVAGFLATVWDRIRMRGLSPSRDLSVRPAAEHAALMMLEAQRAGVRTPALYGLAEARESMLLVTEHVPGARSFAALGADVPDEILEQLWEQIRRAHAAGIAHRELSESSVVVDGTGQVWLLDWDSGETISNELSRRVDLAQTLALVASAVGVKRAISSASQVLTTQQIASIAPMLQSVVLPASTREAVGQHKRGARSERLLQQLRDALIDLTPQAQAEPARITRFSARTVLMAIVGLVAVWTLLAKMNLEQITHAVQGANVWWIAAALVFSLATYLGAGLALVAFSPAKVSVWRSTEVHLASSVVSLVAPAGVGGAAINLRFLSRKGVPTAIGVATVALVQVVQFGVTVVLLVILAATTGHSTGLALPSGWIMIGAAVLVAMVGGALFIPQVRGFVWAKLEPTYRQVWPRMVWVLSNPRRLLLGVGGTLLLSLSYILSFGASLWAFGYTLPFSVLAITYLASNTVGSVVPSPGGIGPVELALTAGLVTAGIPSGVALSAAIVYRLVTFWIPIPIGWLSLQRLQKKGHL